jgi:hypothetical protein
MAAVRFIWFICLFWSLSLHLDLDPHSYYGSDPDYVEPNQCGSDLQHDNDTEFDQWSPFKNIALQSLFHLVSVVCSFRLTSVLNVFIWMGWWVGNHLKVNKGTVSLD